MRLTYIGYQSVVRACYLHQLIDVAGVGCSQLMLTAQLQQRQWNADGIIQVALRIMNIILAAQHCCQQLFGCGFAVSAGDADNGFIKVLSPCSGEVLQSEQGVIHSHYLPFVFAFL